MDLAGLGDGSELNKPSAMKSAFWMVTGFYQSYQSNRLEVELVAEVTRLFGRRTTATFRGPPEDPLFARVKQTIDDAIRSHPPVVAPTRAAEAHNQYMLGRELAGFAGNFWHGLISPIEDWGRTAPEAARRQRNLREAIRALQASLLFEPTNRPARLHLAACLMDPLVADLDQAESYHRQLLDEPVEDECAQYARQALVDSHGRQSPAARQRWFAAAAAQTPNPRSAESFTQQAKAAAAEVVAPFDDTQARQQAEADLIDALRRWREPKQSLVWRSLTTKLGLHQFVEKFGTNRDAAARRSWCCCPNSSKPPRN